MDCFSFLRNSQIRWEDTQVISVQWNNTTWECSGGKDELCLKLFKISEKETFELQRKGQESSRHKIKETDCVLEC